MNQQSDLKRLRRNLADDRRELFRVQARIKTTIDRAARDSDRERARGNDYRADRITDQAIGEVHQLEDRETSLTRRIEDLTEQITTLSRG